MKKLLQPIKVGDIELKNRVFMAPLTRNRSNNNGIPNDLMREYYEQRAGAGLIISEATNITAEGRGYVDTPGIWNDKQVENWKPITKAVHDEGGKIFLQLWHTGRSSHPDFHNGELPVSASAINSGGRAMTYDGLKDKVTPRALETKEIPRVINDYVNASKNAIRAGFDGVEIHGANGYLIDQFICDGSNQRNDRYGGSIENRIRFALEVTEEVCDAIGSGKTGLRLSPSGIFNGMRDSTPVKTFSTLVRELNKYNLAYLHVMEPYSPPGKDYSPVEGYLQDREVTPHFRKIYNGNLVTNSGYSTEEAEDMLQNNIADAVAFGKLFISNPDLPKRIDLDAELNDWNVKTFYGGDEKGYTDYPFLEKNSK